MSLTFKDLQDEVARRATRSESSNQFTAGIKNAINASLLRIGREAYWRVLRRTNTFDTVSSYTTGTGSVSATNGSANVTVTGATFITDDIYIGRLVSIDGSSKPYTIKNITGEETLVLDRSFSGTTTTTGSYEIYPQEEYNLPIQATHRTFLWHEDYGYPYQMNFMTDQQFFSLGIDRTTKGTPTHYRMWGSDWIIEQLKESSTVSIVSSSSSDSGQVITIFGDVSGYPDKETLTVNGTSTVTSVKSFDNVERISKSASTTGRITITGNSGNTTLAVIPAGDIAAGVQYRKVQLYPLPDDVFPMKVFFYKDVYRLVDDNDIHELGQEFDEAIILMATHKLQAETGQVETTNFFTMYKDEIKNLKRDNVDKIDQLLNLYRGGRGGRQDPLLTPSVSYQQLGGSFGPRVR